MRPCGIRSTLPAAAVMIGLGPSVVAQSSSAHPSRDVEITVNQPTTFGTSVFILGDRPELGGGDLTRAVKLEPSNYPLWKATVHLPEGIDASYQTYLRSDAAGAWGNPNNGSPVGPPNSLAVPGAGPAESDGPAVFAHSTFERPLLVYRVNGGDWNEKPMHGIGAGRDAGERLVAVRRFASPLDEVEFFIREGAQPEATAPRVPAAGEFEINAPRVLVQDAQVYGYLPADTIDPPERVDNPAVPMTIFSSEMGENRRFRVLLPRGYDTNTNKRYPVLYMHDGQNVFDQGAFGTWNTDGTAVSMIRLGQMREVIIVAADHGPDRIGEYIPPDDGRRADEYARFLKNELKPLIDVTFRTLTDAENTGVAGSSLGGLVSLYLGLDFADTFGKVGAFSTASWISPFFEARVRTAPSPAGWRVYLDSGDAGTSNDGFGDTIQIRDGLLSKAVNPSSIEGNLRHVVGFGQQHNEAAWAARLPQCLEFLFPLAEEPRGGLADLNPAPFGDVDDDDQVNIDDLYALEQAAGVHLDVDRDGVPSTQADREALIAILREGEDEGAAYWRTRGVR